MLKLNYLFAVITISFIMELTFHIQLTCGIMPDSTTKKSIYSFNDTIMKYKNCNTQLSVLNTCMGIILGGLGGWCLGVINPTNQFGIDLENESKGMLIGCIGGGIMGTVMTKIQCRKQQKIKIIRDFIDKRLQTDRLFLDYPEFQFMIRDNSGYYRMADSFFDLIVSQYDQIIEVTDQSQTEIQLPNKHQLKEKLLQLTDGDKSNSEMVSEGMPVQIFQLETQTVFQLQKKNSILMICFQKEKGLVPKFRSILREALYQYYIR